LLKWREILRIQRDLGDRSAFNGFNFKKQTILLDRIVSKM
jgi:hypothetical protein